jgi:purine-binding chemotaxis protein CheW
MKKKRTETERSSSKAAPKAAPIAGPKPKRARAPRKPRVAASAAAAPEAEAVPEPVEIEPPHAEVTPAPADGRPDAEPDVVSALAEIEARAAAAHARELAEAEAAAEARAAEAARVEPDPRSPVGIARSSQPGMRRLALPDDEDDEDDEDDLYDDRWDDDAYAQHRGPRRPLRERARSHQGLVELLMFRVGNERFAVELLCVEEAIDLGEPHHVPEMPPAMLGVVTVRDTLTPVFSPDDALGVAAVSKGAALIFRSNRGRFALAIDDLDDVTTLDLAQLRDAPGTDGADSLVLGVARNGGGIVALVDADALIATCQSMPIPELA